MKPSPFEYHRPDTVDEVVELLAELPEAELMAGNQSLSIVLSNRLASPEHIVDINDVDELQYLESTEDRIEVGAMVRHRRIESSDLLDEHLAMLSESATQIAGPVVRNRGTLGGSIGEADPAGNYNCVVVALGADIELASTDGRRTVPAEDYFIAHMMTDIEEDELLTNVAFPTAPYPPERTGMTFLAQKPTVQTWPTLAAGGAVRVDDPAAETPTVEMARLGLANAADVPLRLEAVEEAVTGGPLTEEVLDAAGDIAYDEVEPQAEMHADETYKRELAREYTKRALREAHDRATA